MKAPKKPEGKRERFLRNAVPELREFVRSRPCVLESLHECRGPVEVAHVKSRGSGGPDYDNVVPLCMEHHRELHRIGRKSWEFKHQFRLPPVARLITAAYLKHARGAGGEL